MQDENTQWHDGDISEGVGHQHPILGAFDGLVNELGGRPDGVLPAAIALIFIAMMAAILVFQIATSHQSRGQVDSYQSQMLRHQREVIGSIDIGK